MELNGGGLRIFPNPWRPEYAPCGHHRRPGLWIRRCTLSMRQEVSVSERCKVPEGAQSGTPPTTLGQPVPEGVYFLCWSVKTAGQDRSFGQNGHLALMQMRTPWPLAVVFLWVGSPVDRPRRRSVVAADVRGRKGRQGGWRPRPSSQNRLQRRLLKARPAPIEEAEAPAPLSEEALSGQPVDVHLQPPFRGDLWLGTSPDRNRSVGLFAHCPQKTCAFPALGCSFSWADWIPPAPLRQHIVDRARAGFGSPLDPVSAHFWGPGR